MNGRSRGLTCFGFAMVILVALGSFSAYGGGTGKYSAGMTLPGFTLAGPTSAKDQKYLGLKGSEPFALSEISAKMVCVEILSVF